MLHEKEPVAIYVLFDKNAKILKVLSLSNCAPTQNIYWTQENEGAPINYLVKSEKAILTKDQFEEMKRSCYSFFKLTEKNSLNISFRKCLKPLKDCAYSFVDILEMSGLIGSSERQKYNNLIGQSDYRNLFIILNELHRKF